MRSSLLSRCNIYVTEPISQIDIIKILIRGIQYLKQSREIKISREVVEYISIICNGDGRKALSILETACDYSSEVSLEVIKRIAPSKYYRNTKDDKYNYVSWLQGAIQASDPDGAIYALACALEADIDPRYLARRIMVSASEDCAGNPEVATVAHSAYVASCEIGRPECDLILAHAVVLAASCPRNKSAANAIWAALKDVREGVIVEVPKEMRDCHYYGSDRLGHGSYKDGMNQSAYVGVKKRYFYPI
jgi:putative ATPase